MTVSSTLGNGPHVVPEIQVMCGNSDTGTFDDARARQTARELCAIYGLAVQPDQREADGDKSVVLDGADDAARIGFELRGRGCHEMFCEVQPEDEAEALDEEEFAWLAARGYRLHVADVARYRGYGDEFTPTLAYLAGLVAFLNETTSGEDVDLGGLLFEREAGWRPPFVSGEGVTIYSGSGEHDLRVERRTTLVFVCRGLPDFEAAPDRDPWGLHEPPERRLERRRLRSTHGAPSVLCFGGEALGLAPSDPVPEFRLRLHQLIDGAELERESRSLALFLPGAFDLARPFELELELSPGRYVFYGPVRIGAAASAR